MASIIASYSQSNPTVKVVINNVIPNSRTVPVMKTIEASKGNLQGRCRQPSRNQSMMDNNIGEPDVGPSVIELELTDEMRDKQLVTQFLCNYGSKSVILKFKHKYENKIVELYPINIGKGEWTDTLNSCVETLKERGIDEQDRIIVRRSLNQPRGIILHNFSYPVYDLRQPIDL